MICAPIATLPFRVSSSRLVIFSFGICLTLLPDRCDSLCFFFSSRRRHTISDRDWSSDVCSSDLNAAILAASHLPDGKATVGFEVCVKHVAGATEGSRCLAAATLREVVDGRKLRFDSSEERRVGKSVDLGGRRIIKKKKETTKSKS